MNETDHYDTFKWEIIEPRDIGNPYAVPIAAFLHRADAAEFIAIPRFLRKLTLRQRPGTLPDIDPGLPEIKPEPPRKAVIKPKGKQTKAIKAKPKSKSRPRAKLKLSVNGTANAVSNSND